MKCWRSLLASNLVKFCFNFPHSFHRLARSVKFCFSFPSFIGVSNPVHTLWFGLHFPVKNCSFWLIRKRTYVHREPNGANRLFLNLARNCCSKLQNVVQLYHCSSMVTCFLGQYCGSLLKTPWCKITNPIRQQREKFKSFFNLICIIKKYQWFRSKLSKESNIRWALGEQATNLEGP